MASILTQYSRATKRVTPTKCPTKAMATPFENHDSSLAASRNRQTSKNKTREAVTISTGFPHLYTAAINISPTSAPSPCPPWLPNQVFLHKRSTRHMPGTSPIGVGLGERAGLSGELACLPMQTGICRFNRRPSKKPLTNNGLTPPQREMRRVDFLLKRGISAKPLGH